MMINRLKDRFHQAGDGALRGRGAAGEAALKKPGNIARPAARVISPAVENRSDFSILY
jgi:hypothetical protein